MYKKAVIRADGTRLTSPRTGAIITANPLARLTYEEDVDGYVLSEALQCGLSISQVIARMPPHPSHLTPNEMYVEDFKLERGLVNRHKRWKTANGGFAQGGQGLRKKNEPYDLTKDRRTQIGRLTAQMLLHVSLDPPLYIHDRSS